MSKGIPVYYYHGRVCSDNDKGYCCPPQGLALTHSELKELMREAWVAAVFKCVNIGEPPDFETYYQGKQK